MNSQIEMLNYRNTYKKVGLPKGSDMLDTNFFID